MQRHRTLVIVCLASLTLAAPALAGYTSGGTFVVKSQGITVVDNGGVVCDGLTGGGVGGGCLPFPAETPPRSDGTAPGAFIRVSDLEVGERVAFQVCIDNDGDGICGGQPPIDLTIDVEGASVSVGAGECRDQIFFSHGDGGRFFNPLGPLPTSSLKGCPDAFQGYVVLLCEGVHDDREQGPHKHQLSTGTIEFAPDGSGYGDFCGGGGAGGEQGFTNTAAKGYVVN